MHMLSLCIRVYNHHIDDNMDATDGTTCLLLEIEGMPLLHRLDVPKSVDAIGIDRLVYLLHTSDDPRLPARAGGGVCTWMQHRVNTHMIFIRLVGILALDASHAIDG